MFPLHIFMFSRRIFIGAAISIVSLLFAGLLLYQVNAQSLPRGDDAGAAGGASSGTVYLSTSGQADAEAETTSAQKAPMREVHIANNGLVLLRGATVISNSRGTIRVGMAWGPADFTWTIETENLNTEFLTSKGVKATIGDIKAGDTITVTGMLKSSGTEPVVTADYIRE